MKIEAMHYSNQDEMIQGIMGMSAEERAQKVAETWEVWTMADGGCVLCIAQYVEANATDYSDELEVTFDQYLSDFLPQIEAMEEV
jgi:hypothetical protein